MINGPRGSRVGWIALVCAAWGFSPATSAPQQTPPGSGSTVSSQPRTVLDQYCVTCHNTRQKTAGLALDAVDLTEPAANAEVLEKVVRKLRTGDMPPAGRPRPNPATTQRVASWLETELDRAASARPLPGTAPVFHRLSRTEYKYAIRDLLALPDLPAEMDVDVVLPPDSSTTGFDNLADLLFVSPTLLEGYLSVARKISRLAVGDPSIEPLVETYRFPSDLRQDQHVDGLPPGTRGGAVMRSTFPLDGEYVLTIELARQAANPEQIAVSVDGREVERITVFGSSGHPLTDGKYLPVRVALKAGPRVIGVTFVQRLATRTEALVRPALRGRGSQPAMASVTITGPYNAVGPGDTPSRRRLFVCYPTRQAEEVPCARQILSTLARRAYRRPPSDVDLQDLLAFYDAGLAEGGFEKGIQRALARLLVSPRFLFRIERDPPTASAGTVYRLGDLELASRLSFFLWSSIPDDELLDLAIRGELQLPGVLDQQVRRMLADPRSESLVTNFAAQWLYLRDVPTRRPDGIVFQNFDEGLRQAFQRETELFLRSVLLEDRSVLDLLQADYTFVNERLAAHYDIPNVYGSHFRRVTLAGNSPRRGLLGHGGILMLTSYATRTSPVLRGKWILDNLLGAPPPPPPANVPALRETADDDKPLSLRDAMVRHRANPVCASCHARMDPLGFALENFDAVGRWRSTSESGIPVDASGAFTDGTTFEGAAGLRQVLLQRGDQFVSTVTEKLLMYALGRKITHHDAPTVRAVAREAGRHGHRFSAIVLAIVDSVPFQMRRVDSQASASRVQ